MVYPILLRGAVAVIFMGITMVWSYGYKPPLIGILGPYKPKMIGSEKKPWWIYGDIS